MKNIISAVVIGLLLLLASESQAAGKPAWGLFSDTAYNIKEGQWNASVIGWANYGMTSRLQLGTNAILYLFQIPNMYVKFVTLEESDTNPQIAIGSSLYYPLAVSTPISTDFSVTVSRGFDNGNYLLTGGIKETMNINDTNVATTNPINTPGLGFKIGFIANKSDTNHFFVEAYSNWVPIGRSSEIGIGTDFVSGNQTISFGGLFYAADSMNQRASFLPFANCQWTF